MTEETQQAGQETTQSGQEGSQAGASESEQQQTQQGEQTRQTQQGGESTQEGQQGEQTQAGEQQTDEGGSDGPPEEYGEFTLPEGVEVDQETLDTFKTKAKELGLSQEKAQELVDLQAQTAQSSQKQLKDAIAQQHQQWLDQAKQDEEIGGEQFDQNVETARKAIETFGTPELKQFLDESGLGNNPEMIRFARRIGAAISEDSLTPGGSGRGKQNPADVLFDNS
jgi:hypothetical protein